MVTVFFSIIVPTYNRCAIVGRAIRSVLNQSVGDFELIIVDDGSTDDTANAVRPYLQDARVRYFFQTNQGVGSARNFGASQATGAYLIFLDSDDELKPGYLYAVKQKMGGMPDMVFVGVEFIVDGEFKKAVLPSRPYGRPSEDGYYLAGTFIVSRPLFHLVGGYDPVIRYGENTELSIRLHPVLKKKEFIDSPLLRVVQVTRGRASTSPANVINSIRYVLNKHSAYYNRNKPIKWRYLNILGVALLRARKRKSARKIFLESIRMHPAGWKQYIYFLRTLSPI